MNSIPDTSDPLILRTFYAYARAFELLIPSTVLTFYHYPAVLISDKKTIKIINKIVGYVVFKVAMRKLLQRNYKYSKTESLEVRQLGKDLAIVTGTVIRFKANDTELERFNLNYTMRKVDDEWKIVIGVLLTIT